MNYTKSIFLVLICALVGAGYGYLQSIQREQVYRSVARFRVVMPVANIPLPTLLIDGPVTADQGAKKTQSTSARPVYHEGDKVRQADVLRLAVTTGNLHRVKSLRGTTVEAVVTHLAARPELAVSIVGLLQDSAIFEIRFDANDPELAFRVVNSILNAYAEIHFPDQVPSAVQRSSSDALAVRQLIEQLDSAEIELRQRSDDWLQFASVPQSTGSFRDVLAAMREKHDFEQQKQSELVDRYNSARALANSQKPLLDILAALRGSADRITESDRTIDTETLRSNLRDEIKLARDAIDKQNAVISSIADSIDREIDKMRQYLAAKTDVEQSQQRVDELRRKYEDATSRLNQNQNPKSLRDASRPSFEIIQAAGPGALIRTGIPPEIKLGVMCGFASGAVLSMLSWAATAAIRERRRRAW